MGKTTTILGLSAYYHDSAAAIVRDGTIVAAAQEERFSRRKHDPAFPKHAVDFCLTEAGISADDLDYVVFYDKPLLKFERILETYLAYAPAGLSSFLTAVPQWLKTKLHLPREIRAALGGTLRRPIVFTGHHEAHAASAFYPSPFQEAAILTIDGVGEWDTATIAQGSGHQITQLSSLKFPHSLGLLYSAFTYFCGFRVNSGEYKLMGLAPYGRPRFEKLILEKLLRLHEDGSFALDLRYFDYCVGLTMTSPAFSELFGGPPRPPESPITQREMDLAASIQVVTEEIVLRMARTARRLTNTPNLCLAGGVALNCVANGKLLKEKIFEKIFVTPASGDAGGALGAALFVHHQLLGQPRTPSPGDSLRGSFLGPRYEPAAIKTFLNSTGLVFAEYNAEAELLKAVAAEIALGKVVGWFHGRMEFGPRALGARSILGDARNATMQSTMNRRIKFRESFRPFAPCVLREDASKYFDLESDSPYMLMVAPVQTHLLRSSTHEAKLPVAADLIDHVNQVRSTIPAVTHVDNSARIQTVDEQRNGRFYRLLREFKHQTGCSVLINTSFNVRGEPIVCTPQEALRCFLATDLDVLVLEDCVVRKTDLPPLDQSNRAQYLQDFKLD